MELIYICHAVVFTIQFQQRGIKLDNCDVFFKKSLKLLLFITLPQICFVAFIIRTEIICLLGWLKELLSSHILASSFLSLGAFQVKSTKDFPTHQWEQSTLIQQFSMLASCKQTNLKKKAPCFWRNYYSYFIRMSTNSSAWVKINSTQSYFFQN